MALALAEGLPRTRLGPGSKLPFDHQGPGRRPYQTSEFERHLLGDSENPLTTTTFKPPILSTVGAGNHLRGTDGPRGGWPAGAEPREG